MKYEPLPAPDLSPECDRSEIPACDETPPCPVCGSSEDGIVVGTRGRYRMDVRNVVCRTCSLVYQRPRPDAERMKVYYSGPYRKHYGDAMYPVEGGGLVGKGAPGFEAALDAWHRVQAENSLRLTPARPGESVLEIGCRHGRTLCIMRDRAGIVPHGIEPGPNEAEEAVAAGVQCFCGVLGEYQPGDQRFARIQLFHVLEHLHEPLADLVRLRTWLADEGKIVIEVPNVTQPYGALEGNFFQNVHLTNFSAATLSELLRRAGFRVDRVVDGTSLFAVGTAVAGASLEPLPFDPSQLDRTGADPEWIAACLENYGQMEDLKNFILARELNLEVFNLLCRRLRQPAFVPHLVAVVSDLAVLFVRAQAVREAVLLIDAALSGPHPEEIKEGLRRLSVKVQAAA